MSQKKKSGCVDGRTNLNDYNYKIKFSKTDFDVGLTKPYLKTFNNFSSLKALQAVVKKKMERISV